jgi:membrane protein
MPSEFPERWSRFLPPEDVTARLRTHVKSTHTKSTNAAGQADGEAPPPAEK